jgi:hypothetical protein
MVKDHHAIAGPVVAYSLAHRCDHSGSFMAENPGRGMGTGGDLLEVRAANSTRVDPYQHLAGADLGNRDSLEADIVDAAIHRSLHGCGDRMRRVFDRVLSGNSHEVF